ncbi:hypothetical protein [Wolbachia endosymbiont of Litomosoides brasiliensis]|uniref:hypothetical protein n=1 Tax=Wolbachia endosymbiont of Litomosoides brasiliensis TaxID=1812117 RepID=UPI00158E9076|nr:hypothetical protein [Wolbachia endosymbiont of Litomosoides brasiliensis]
MRKRGNKFVQGALKQSNCVTAFIRLLMFLNIVTLIEKSLRSKNMLHFKNSIDYMDKAPEIWKRSKIVYSPQCCRKTRLN